ncbi:MAG: MFS transporter [Alphaproteobacteria bacterium]|nr:MFS transporter [Alphaproteobacteria bacterium]
MSSIAVADSATATRELNSYRTKFFYGLGSVAFGAKNAGFNSLMMLYYNQIIGLSAQAVGLAIFIALVVDAIADPLVGQMSDNLRSRWGRRHPFMYFSAIPVGLSFFFLWVPPDLDANGMFIYLTLMSIVVRIFITMFEIPNSAMIAEITTDYDQRTTFLSIRYFFGVLGGAALGFVTYRYILLPDAIHPVGQLNPAGYPTYGIVAGVLMTSIIIISSLGTHRYIKYFRQPEQRRATLKQTLGEVTGSLSNSSFVVLMSAAICGTLAIGITATLSIYFSTYFWGLSAKSISIFQFAGVAAAVLGVLTSTPLSRRFGKRQLGVALFIAFIFTSALPISLRLIGFFPVNGSPWLIPLLFADRLLADTMGIIVLIMFASMLTDVVEDNELKTKRRSEGLFFAASAFVTKVISGGGHFIGGLLLAMVAFPTKADPKTLDPQIMHNLAYVYMPTIILLFSAGMVLMSRYRITRESHLENLRQLEEAATLGNATAAELE